MANVKLSQLQELKNITKDQAQESYVMVVAYDDTGKLKNYRTKVSELSKYVETDGVIQGTLTADEITRMINNAIKDHETINTPEETIIIPEKLIEVDTTLKDVTSKVGTVESTVTDVKTTLDETTTKVDTIDSTVTDVKTTLDETTTKVDTIDSTVTDVKITLDETTTKVENNKTAITNINKEIEILKTTTPNLDCVTEEHAIGIFEECFKKINDI